MIERLSPATARRRINAFAAILLIFALLLEMTIAPAASSKTVKKKVKGTCNYNYAQQIVKMVNPLRNGMGLTTVTLDKELTDAAMQRAAEISLSFSHTRPDGKSWKTVNKRAAAENIASGYSSPQSVYNGWKGSAGHYANMTRSGYTAIGVGCFYDGKTWYWVQLFGYKLRKKDSRSSTAKKTFTVNVKETKPQNDYSAPTLSSVKENGANEVKLTWTPTKGITEYELHCLMPGASQWVQVKLSNVGYSKNLGTVLMGLIYKGQYQFKIRGVYKLNGVTKYTDFSATKTLQMR